MNKQLTLGYVPMGTGQVSPFDQIFTKSVKLDPYKSPDEIKLCDAIVVWGGADISPATYNDPVHPMTHASEALSYRDHYEVDTMELAIKHGIPIIGVCRGAQLACAVAGGKLIQHVDNHGRDHYITTHDGRSIVTSSVHHQMMHPDGVEHKLLAWSAEVRSKVHYMGNGENITVEKEPEIVYFPKIKALAIQGHPEFMDEEAVFVKYCNDLVRQYLLNVKVEEVCT